MLRWTQGTSFINNETILPTLNVYCRINVVRMLLECELVSYESNYSYLGRQHIEATLEQFPQLVFGFREEVHRQPRMPDLSFHPAALLKNTLSLHQGLLGRCQRSWPPYWAVTVPPYTHLSDRSSPPPDQTRTVTVNISSHLQWAGNHKQTHQHSILLYIACSQKQTVQG